ncbi:hypothetical protein AtNW77_Chr3g0159661 [Arabidopsis thaliana]
MPPGPHPNVPYRKPVKTNFYGKKEWQNLQVPTRQEEKKQIVLIRSHAFSNSFFLERNKIKTL